MNGTGTPKKRKAYVWTDEAQLKARQLFSEGYNDAYIAERLGPKFTASSVDNWRRHAGVTNAKIPAQRAPFTDLPHLLTLKPHQLLPVEASVLHLLDLKWAGHSPTRTEENITRDGAPARFYIAPSLMYRSPAAALVEG